MFLSKKESANRNVGSALVVGAEIPVGEFFWIKTCIGMASNACHGHAIRQAEHIGSANVDCAVRILSIDRGIAMVVLLRPELPYGAEAPHGTIFLIPMSVIEQWPQMTVNRLYKELVIGKMQQHFRNVAV